ncbi:MAG: IS607 family transposase [Candidatus Paceibacterota bacterium]|jgi:putative resolvase
MTNHVTLLRASQILGVTTQTLRDWDNRGIIKTVRTAGNQRRIPEYEISRLLGSNKIEKTITIAYCRVSTQKQDENLERQVGRVLEYCATQKWNTELYKDIGSGLNDNRKEFKKLIKRVANGDVLRVVIEYKDRIARFGFDTFFEYCNAFGTDIVVLNEDIKKEFEQEFAEDVIALVTSYAARLHGRRGGRRKHGKVI